MSNTFLFIAKEGKMSWFSTYNHERFLQNLRENEGKQYRIELDISTRSMSQNKLYWLYLEVIEKETGNSADNLHQLFRRTLLPPKFIKIEIKGKKQEIKIPKSTTELKKNEFCDYMDKICAETNIPIPDSEKWNEWKDSSPLADETYQRS